MTTASTAPIRPGTARRLGLRPPHPYANYPQRWIVSVPQLRLQAGYGPPCCEAGEQAWPDPCPWHPR